MRSCVNLIQHSESFFFFFYLVISVSGVIRSVTVKTRNKPNHGTKRPGETSRETKRPS